MNSVDARHYAACDLGAESGRVIVGTLRDGILTLDEIHRFPTGACRIGGTLRWNILRIFEEIRSGLKAALAKYPTLTSVSVDSWGVDYVYFREVDEPLLALPYHYRDPRNDPHYAALSDADRSLIFGETGIQFMSINTLYQLIDDVAHRQPLLQLADRFLNIADYLNYLLSGVVANEVSNASTTQMYNPMAGAWSSALIDRFGLPRRLFPRIVPSGTLLGKVREEHELGAHLNVVATASHDTAASVAAVPAGSGEDWAYLSSGTWSLVGVELDRPLITDAARQANFTNEIGVGNSVRFLKNAAGLWIIQECRREWARQGKALDYATIASEAASAPTGRSRIDPSDPRFMKPGEMVQKVQTACAESGQPVPRTVGEVARCVYESLAALYASYLKQLENLTDRKINTLHIVGGGSQNTLLNQCTADATGKVIVTGPVESTAIGNIMIQAMVDGRVESLPAIRAGVARSFRTQRFLPGTPARI